MNNSIKDLEVLSKYLSEEELKDIAKQVAYESFKNSIGSGNPHSKDNIEFYIKYGAYEAVVQHAKENALEDIFELSKQLNTKVAKIINSLQSYHIPYTELIKEALDANKDTIIKKVDEVLSDKLDESNKSYDAITSLVSEQLGYLMGDRLFEYFKQSFKEDGK